MEIASAPDALTSAMHPNLRRVFPDTNGDGPLRHSHVAAAPMIGGMISVSSIDALDLPSGAR
jgi:hypothetical protein